MRACRARVWKSDRSRGRVHWWRTVLPPPAKAHLYGGPTLALWTVSRQQQVAILANNRRFMTSPLPLRQPLRLTFRSAERTQNQGEYRKKHSRDHLEEAHTPRQSNGWPGGHEQHQDNYRHRSRRASRLDDRKLLRIAREGNEPVPVRHSHVGQRLRVEHVVGPDDAVETKDVGGHRVDLVAR